MKEKYEALKVSIKAALDEAEKFINEGKFDEAKAKQAEAKSLKAQAEVMKVQLEAKEADEKEAEALKSAELAKKNAELEAAAKKPARLPFEADSETAPENTGLADSVSILKYGKVEDSIKAVISDLYGGTVTNYNEARKAQGDAFVKYLRFGEARLTAQEQTLLVASAKTLILRPEVIKAEIMAGKSVAEIKATLVEATNDLGGYLVPEDYRAEIIKRLMGNTVVRQRARVITTTRDAVEWPRLEGGNTIYTSAVRVTWVPETPASATAANTNPTFGLIRIPVHTVMARTNLSRNLLEDSAFNLLDTLSGLFAEAMAVDEDAQFLTGQGAGTPRGVLGARANGNQASPVVGVSAVASGNATAVTADGFVQLVYGLASQYRKNAIHVMARTTQRDLRLLKDGEGRYMWQPGLIAGQPASLLGYAVEESESMDAVAANAHVDIFGDWGQGYVIVDRVGMSVERVTDTTTTGQNQIAIFARRRLGGDVVAPWAFVAAKCSV